MSQISLTARLEAVLFVAGDPVSLETLAGVLGVQPDEVELALEELSVVLEGRGLQLLREANSAQLTTVPAAALDVEKYLHSEEEVTLSSAALETLAIIAYQQPVTRIQIDAIRGVNSESSVKTLIRLGLVTELERLEQPGRPIAYGTTSAFLRVFGLSSLDELPPLESATTANKLPA